MVEAVRFEGLPARHSPELVAAMDRDDLNDNALCELQIAVLFAARGQHAQAVVEAADALRHQIKGDSVTYVVNRNINYTDICADVRTFCAFSSLEIWQGANTLGMTTRDYLMRLKDDGLGSLPGTSAEILCDDVRRVICPEKQTVAEWPGVVCDAHLVGLATTATIKYGHNERPKHWARHLFALRRLQDETGGITEFGSLPCVHMKSPMYRRGQSRKGPSWREALMMHAVARIALHGSVDPIQCSWVRLGLDGAAAALAAGANDLGGVLMNESISRAAGAEHGQEISVADLQAVAASAGRVLKRRSTLYKLLDEVKAENAPA